MFVTAIERAGGFTRPIHTITRLWGSGDIIPGSATIFFVNKDGWALTCGHVAQLFVDANAAGERFAAFQAERNLIPASKKGRQSTGHLEKKFGYKAGQVVELHTRFVGCVEGALNLDIKIHPKLDMALLKFQGFSKILCDNFPVFARDGSQLKQGKTLCRLGFPFPEFNNYAYYPDLDQIGWTNTGIEGTPQFPIDGMLTRLVAGEKGEIIGFELSTPGIRGQSGGPAFDTEGRVWGMQSMTKHLDLDFDVDVELRRGASKRRVRDSAFLHVGGCIHVDSLKRFMRENGVAFDEG